MFFFLMQARRIRKLVREYDRHRNKKQELVIFKAVTIYVKAYFIPSNKPLLEEHGEIFCCFGPQVAFRERGA